eukprot:scaffold9547_cov53-Attheya_sp.AAC.2
MVLRLSGFHVDRVDPPRVYDDRSLLPAEAVVPATLGSSSYRSVMGVSLSSLFFLKNCILYQQLHFTLY